MPKFLLRSAALVGAVALVPAVTTAFAATDVETYRQLDQFMTVFERVRSEYVTEVDEKELIQGAINGMLASLDPHSSYMDESDFTKMREQTEGEYAGLGVLVTMEDGVVKVVAPTDDTPAARAGIKAGDFITHIDGKLMYGLTIDEAVTMMKGPQGSQAKLTIVREGAEEPLQVSLVRQIVQTKPVKFEAKGDVGYIRISTFLNSHTADATRDAVEKLQKQLGPKLAGYVIDLRSNGGGLLDEAIGVTDLFLERGEIVSQRGRGNRAIERHYARPGDVTGGKPIVVLVDAGSASASEILAGALQDHHRALVLGERSFGKGLVQSLIPMSGNTALRLSTALYYTPAGNSVQEKGIEPDITVPQLTDKRTSSPRLREADLRRHLLSQPDVDQKVLEEDGTPDPRFAASADELKKKGITDFQLHYAVQMVARTGKQPTLGGPAKTAARR